MQALIDIDIDEAIGDSLRGKRCERRLTQQDVGDMMGVSSATVRNWEKGTSISLASAAKLANLYGLSIDELVGKRAKEILNAG